MSGTPISVQAGSVGSSTISLSSTSGTGRVYLSCTTTAPKATCAINSGDPMDQYTVDFSNSASGTATVNVTTTANTAGLLKPNLRLNNRAFLASTFAFVGFIFVGLLFIPANWNRNLRRGLGGAAFMLVLIMHPGCGGSSNSGGGTGTAPGNGTAPGSYTVTVSSYTVSNTSGNPDSTVTFNLTVN
jgi:hypothetical protein